MTGNVPNWIQRLLGLDVEPGHGVAWRVVWGTVWPDWVWWILVAVAIFAAIGLYFRRSALPQLTRRRRSMLMVLRLLAVAVLLLMIAQPELQLEKTDLPTFAVVLDDSMSMTTTDTPGKVDKNVQNQEKTRLDRAKSILLADQNRLLREMARRYRTDVYRLSDLGLLSGEDATDLDAMTQKIKTLEATGQATRLGEAVTSILGRHFGAEPAGILLLTDGINTEGPDLKEAAASAKRLGVPLYTVGIGSEKTEPRLKLSDLSVEEVVFVGDTLRFQVTLHGPGHEGETVHVDLHRKESDALLNGTIPDETTPTGTKPNGATSNGTILLDEATVTIPEDGAPLPVQLHYTPREEGSYTFLVSIREEPGVAPLQRTVRAYKEQIRVLLAAAGPSYEYRFLRNLLHREPSIQPMTFLADADPRSAEQDPTALPVFPVRREELFEYDVLILMDLAPSQLGHRTMENLAAFVQETDKGGAILFVAGPGVMPAEYRETPLARLLPVDVEQLQMPDDDPAIRDGFQVMPTEDGLQQPPLQLGDTTPATREIWQSLPPLYWMLKAERLKPTARVWAVNPNEKEELYQEGLPVLVMQYVGAGRVLMQLTDETWRWRGEDRLEIYNRYWLQTIRYLARSMLIEASQEVTLSTEKSNYHYGEAVPLRVKFHDPRLAPDRDDGVQLSISRQGGSTQSLQLVRTGSRSTFTGSLPRPEIGSYHAWLRSPSLTGVNTDTPSTKTPPSVDFTVEAPPGEFAEIRMNAEGLREASEQTAGHYFPFAKSRQLASVLPKGHPVTIEPLPPHPLWNRWPVLVLLFGLFTAEWSLRRRWGL